MGRVRLLTCLALLFLSCTSIASAELLALLNYESKPNQPVRREGIAIMEIDPDAADFGKILMDIPLPPDLSRTTFSSTATGPKPISRP